MLATRIIPCLDVDDGRVVKGIKFSGLKDAGDPVELARRYNEQGADELIFLDVGASYKSRDILLEIVEKISRVLFIPLTVGGGLRDIVDMRKVLNAGADKVAICTRAIEEPELLKKAAHMFGSQCIVISIDARRCKDSWHAFSHGGRNDSGLDAVQWARQAVEYGAGEILLNSIDMDGTNEGYDLELIRIVSAGVNVPVIASGGAGDLEQISDAVIKGKADAVLLASLLHYQKYAVKDIKTYLERKGVIVRW
jgi:cyclase